jgi:hypothetical protein
LGVDDDLIAARPAGAADLYCGDGRSGGVRESFGEQAFEGQSDRSDDLRVDSGGHRTIRPVSVAPL